ncbi:Cell division protein FtsA [compost metagenome]
MDKEFTQEDLAAIAEPRVQEIFQLIRQEVKRLGYSEQPGGYILIGGTVSMPGLLKIAQQELEASVRIAVPDFIGVRDPAFTGGVGILHKVIKNIRVRSSASPKKNANRSKAPGPQETARKTGLMERLKNLFSEFI